MVNDNKKEKIIEILAKALAPLDALRHLSRVDWANIKDAKISKKSNKGKTIDQKLEEIKNTEKG